MKAIWPRLSPLLNPIDDIGPTMSCHVCGKSLTTNDINLRAMEAVEKFEREHGRIPKDVSRKPRLGYDVESADAVGRERLIEVKGYGHEGLGFALRWSQHRAAIANPDKYWFYFVYQCHSETPRVEPV